MPLAVTVLVTLLVYWAAGGYAELLGEHAHSGRLPSWSHASWGDDPECGHGGWSPSRCW
jgi:hypothetical protein